MTSERKSKRIEVQVAEGAESAEDREFPAEEPSEGMLPPSPELEEALREAAAAVEETEAEARAESESAEESEAAPAEGEESSENLALELKQTQDRLLRLQADFENFRRRALRERTEAYRYGHQNLVKDLLSTVDNLDRAIDHAQKSGDGDLDSLLQGVDLVRRDLLTALARNGVTPIEAVGKTFDPAHHEAVAQAPDGSVAPNTVTEELQKGYLLRDRLLRPSRVIVSRAPDEEGTDAATTQEGEDTD